jgi:streptomycin 6-kinase
MVRVLEHEPGAALLERLSPGTPLAEVVNAGDDERATDALAQVITSMLQINPAIDGLPTVEQWGLGFDRYVDSRDWQIPGELVADAQARYRNLCSTQGARRLLHGDLQHYNVLADDKRGWVAIDPKGVVGEIEFELGAALRNPHEIPDLYATASAVERRVRQLADALHLDAARILQWAYVQGVLSAIWTTEDDGFVSPIDPALCLAATIRPFLDT